MERNKRDFYSAAGYDAVARKKIKELEEKVGGGAGGSGGDILIVPVRFNFDEPEMYEDYTLGTYDVPFDDVIAAINSGKAVFAREYYDDTYFDVALIPCTGFEIGEDINGRVFFERYTFDSSGTDNGVMTEEISLKCEEIMIEESGKAGYVRVRGYISLP